MYLYDDIGELGKTMSMRFKALGVHLQHEGVLKRSVAKSLYFFPLGSNFKVTLLLWLQSPTEGGSKILA
jgi:hypothetical protein